MTALRLLAELQRGGCVIRADGRKLAVTGTVSSPLKPYLRVLHTGIRATLAGKRWYGVEGKTGRGKELKPGNLIPPGVTLLCVESDTAWDRLPPESWVDAPDAFEQPKTDKTAA